MKKLFCAALTAAAFVVVLTVFTAVKADAQAASSAEIVMEAESGRVLHEANADERLPMASTTKILTALIIVEDCDLDAVVTVPDDCAGIEGSSIYLVAGERLTVRDLLYGLMLRSGNDCAETLAVYHSGSIGKFAECMNGRALSLGAKHSHFVNPHGLPDPEHYTTARDLGKIACKAMQNATFKEIASSRTAVVPDGGCGYARTLVNKNKFLYDFDGANGVKTGFTKAAGRCLVASAERDGMQLISVVLNCGPMYERCGELLEKAFSDYSYCKIFDAAANKYEVKTDVGHKICIGACRKDIFYPLTQAEAENIRIEADCPSPRKLPVNEGDELGILRVYLENQLLFSQKIYSINSVEKSWTDILRGLARKFARSEEECASINTLRQAASPAAARAISS